MKVVHSHRLLISTLIGQATLTWQTSTTSDSFNHLQNNGVAEGRRFSPFVDLNFYRNANPDLTNLSNEQAFTHLQTNGINEPRRFSPFVDLNFYLAANQDVAQAFGGNRQQAFTHLQTNGINEPRPLFSFC
jgi:hypothetical protein